MTTGRINQVAFLRDVRPVRSSSHHLGGGEAVTGRDRRSCRGTKCETFERSGSGPYAHEIFRIRKHDRAPMPRCGRFTKNDTIGTPGTIEAHRSATRPPDGTGLDETSGIPSSWVRNKGSHKHPSGTRAARRLC